MSRVIPVVYVAVVRVEPDYVLLTDDGSAIVGFRTESEGLSRFERMYDSAHTCSYESSMSACLNWLFFQPSIVRVAGDTVQVVRDWLLDPEKPSVVRHSSISGSVTGLALDSKWGRIAWELGTRPRLSGRNVP